jgi:hypothetical protein
MRRAMHIVLNFIIQYVILFCAYICLFTFVSSDGMGGDHAHYRVAFYMKNTKKYLYLYYEVGRVNFCCVIRWDG